MAPEGLGAPRVWEKARGRAREGLPKTEQGLGFRESSGLGVLGSLGFRESRGLGVEGVWSLGLRESRGLGFKVFRSSCARKLKCETADIPGSLREKSFRAPASKPTPQAEENLCDEFLNLSGCTIAPSTSDKKDPAIEV